MKKFVEILPDKSALVQRSLELVLTKINTALATRGKCTIALAGGSTPKPIYEALADRSLPWQQIQVFWGDERYVAAEHADSNQKMARQAWLDKVDIPAANVHPMPTGAKNPQLDAQNYEQEIRQYFQISESDFPIFDVILLGMGDDGHTASLFPHTEALKVQDSLVTVGNKDGQPRLTFTAPLINHARCVIFLVAGENKRPALKQVFATQADAETYPARLIQPQNELWWLLDSSAGVEIKEQMAS
ncbi:MAG: 6-phosphogluconolactonase [Xenococcaceae cyanobacterium MO_188.B32]|nr:6-phosphogluconolactonase [Xenococcaceae cyanobacterium MO_188.B32]